jgi:Transposase IS116/IS110/IS902 family
LAPNTVNEFHIGYLRNANIIGQPKGGLGVSLASQGFVTGANTPGIVVQDSQFEGVQNIDFPGFTMGVPITNETQINEHPNGIFNGTFNINGTETGDPYADFLLGVASSFQQSSGPPFYLRNRYIGSYVQDSWRARNDLTINAGLRWDIIMLFWEKYNQLQTYVPGEQSVLYPGAPAGIVVPGDPGVPSTIAPTSYKNFAPRIGLAYAPHFDHGFGRLLFGDSGKSSLRASYGIFYTQFPGVLTGIMYAVPPYGFTYISPGPPLLTTPFLTAATGVNNGQRFPFALPPHNVSASNPDNAIDWANFLPFQSYPFFNVRDRAPYLNNYMFSFQRQINQRILLTVSYVGNQAHRVPVVVSVNPGNAALCLSLAPACGPFGEDNTYTTANGQPVYGTRMGQNTGTPSNGGETFGENTSDSTIASSNYNALESTLRYQHNGSQFLLRYTYAKSIDQGSNIGEQLDPLDHRHSRTISAWDQKHSLVASYTLALPVQSVFRATNNWTNDWSLSGTTRFATGFPVTLTDNADDSLLGTLGNGVNNFLVDTPQYLGGPLGINRDGRNGRTEFDTAVFPEENLGQLGNAKRRMFYGPGIDNFDLTLQKSVKLHEVRSIDVRAERRTQGLLLELKHEWDELERRIEEASAELQRIAKQDDACSRLMEIPGIGPLVSTALVASVGNAITFRKGRDLAVWLGLVPRQHSTGGRPKL